MKNVIMIDVQEWNKIVSSTYWKPYNFQQQDWCKDRWTFKFNVPNDEWDEYEWIEELTPVSQYETNMWVDFMKWQWTPAIIDWPDWREEVLKWERYFYPSVYSVANDLFNRWLLAEWEYLINIDW